jgi:hypothetical protein
METYQRQARFTELRPYDHTAGEGDFMEVSEWHNSEGFDVTMNDRVMSFTWGQWECLQALVAYKG